MDAMEGSGTATYRTIRGLSMVWQRFMLEPHSLLDRPNVARLVIDIIRMKGT